MTLRDHDSVTMQLDDAARRQELLDLLDPQRDHMFANGAETVQRLYDLLDCDVGLMKEAFAMLYALPCATVMYYGDEIGMANASLPPGEDDMRYTVRAPFDWEEAERQMNDRNSLWHTVRRLIAARSK